MSSDRVNSIIVVLDHDVPEDQLAEILTALRMVKGVLGVEPHVVSGPEIFAGITERMRLSALIGNRIFEFWQSLKGELDGKTSQRS